MKTELQTFLPELNVNQIKLLQRELLAVIGEDSSKKETEVISDDAYIIMNQLRQQQRQKLAELFGDVL